MSPWLCSCRDARRIASCHNISRFTTPDNLTVGTKLESYRASGLVLRPIAACRAREKRTFADFIAQYATSAAAHTLHRFAARDAALCAPTITPVPVLARACRSAVSEM